MPVPARRRLRAPDDSRGRLDQGIGARVRALRQARGLTQAQLAGDDFSKGFISLVETGRTRLSLRSAIVFASRLGVPLADLVGPTLKTPGDVELLLVRAERELSAGNTRAALELAQTGGTGPLRPRFLRLRGRALLQEDRAREAVPILEDALAAFRAQGQKELAARTVYDLAFAHARLDEPEEALVLALECEGALRSGDVVDRTLELQVRAFLAAVHVRRGDFAAADLHAERALKLAQDVSDREALAALYGSLAAAKQEQGDSEAALHLWERSRRELEHLGRDRAVADAWHNIATVYLLRGNVAKTRDALARAERLAEELNHPRLFSRISVVRARLALRAGNATAALRLAGSAAADPAASALSRAEARLAIAEALDAQRAPLARVRGAFEAALHALESEPAGVRALALRVYADALARRGDLRAAYERAREALGLLRPGEAGRPRQ